MKFSFGLIQTKLGFVFLLVTKNWEIEKIYRFETLIFEITKYMKFFIIIDSRTYFAVVVARFK